jgi:outer membrane protein assembly factor BamB
MRTSAYLLAIAVGAFTVAAVSAGDWAQWRGPEQNGVSREIGLVDDWSLEGNKNVLWVSPIGGRATPIVMNGRIYLDCRSTHDVNDSEQLTHAQEQVVCRDANTGEVLWTDQFNVFQTDVPAPRVGWASMTGDSETGYVYLHSVSGIFRCYAPDGKVVWEYSLHEEFGKVSGYGGRTQTPIIDEDRVIVGFFGVTWAEGAVPPPKQTYYAFDKRTGKLLWTAAPGGAVTDTNYSCPVIAVINGTRMLIGGDCDGGIHAINARTGEHLWGFMMSKRGLNVTPVVDGNHVYISHGEDNVDSTEFGRIQCIDATGQGDVTKTHSVWRIDGIKAGYTALLVKDGVLYVVADTGNLHAIDSKTGKQLWVYNLGTVGKGSPVWADGKLYATEVNGNIHILRPSREKCESLSQVHLPAANGQGHDEIYASAAIANGKVYLVSRDRTICLGVKDAAPKSDPIPPLPEEKAMQETIAKLQLVPAEARVMNGGEIAYELRAFDKNGRLIKTLAPTLEPQKDLPGAKVEGAKLVFAPGAAEQAGHVVAKLGELTASARVRVFPPLPWKWDFEGYTGKQVPPTWVGAASRVVPEQVDGSTAIKKSGGKDVKGLPTAYIWLGPSELTGYTIQADVMMREASRRLPSIGVTANRYNLILKGNTSKLTIQTWPAHPRVAKEIPYRSDPNIWYTIKLRVDIATDGAHVRGKVWKRGASEPEAWTIEQHDPHANLTGSPGLYLYSLADCFYDNVIVSKN